MAKKRGKSKAKPISKKHPKKSSPKKSRAPVEAKKQVSSPAPLRDALHELEILAEEKKMDSKLETIQKDEKEIEKEEFKVMAEEKKVKHFSSIQRFLFQKR